MFEEQAENDLSEFDALEFVKRNDSPSRRGSVSKKERMANKENTLHAPRGKPNLPPLRDFDDPDNEPGARR